MNIVAIIPAWGGSKGIPRKNLCNLGGIPLIAWSIKQAQACSSINNIYVSTDDSEIAEISRYYGAEIPFMRPATLALDTTTTVDSISFFLGQLVKIKKLPDLVVLLQPTQPFRSIETISNAIKLAQKKQSGVVSVSPVKENPILMRKLIKNTSQIENILSEQNSTIRRQDFPEIYRVNGAVYVNSPADYFAKKSLNDNRFCVITSKLEGVDIDEPEDLQYANWLIDRGIVTVPSIQK